MFSSDIATSQGMLAVSEQTCLSSGSSHGITKKTMSIICVEALCYRCGIII